MISQNRGEKNSPAKGRLLCVNPQKTGEEETGHKACMKSKNREEKARPAMSLKAQNRKKTGDEL